MIKSILRDTTRREFIQLTGLASSTALFCWPDMAKHGSVFGAEDLCPSIHCDQDGLIVHRKGSGGALDGGDTAQREGWYWFGVWIRKQINDPWTSPRKLTFPDVLRLLEPKGDGVFYRHPKLPPWNDPYSKEWGFSRDQMIPLMAAMGVWGYADPLRRLWNALPQDAVGGTKHTFNGEWKPSKDLKLLYTGDIVGPAAINLYRRALGEDPMLASDHNGPGGEQELATNVTERLVASKDRDNTGDDLNLIVMLLMSILRSPSAVSTGAVNIYAKNREVSYGSFLGAYYDKYAFQDDIAPDLMKHRIDDGIAGGWTTDASRVYGAVRWYHRAESGANPKLAELYAPIIRKYLE